MKVSPKFLATWLSYEIANYLQTDDKVNGFFIASIKRSFSGYTLFCLRHSKTIQTSWRITLSHLRKWGIVHNEPNHAVPNHGKYIMKVLFLCTHNACRSILAQSITASIGNDGLEALEKDVIFDKVFLILETRIRMLVNAIDHSSHQELSELVEQLGKAE